MIAWIRVYRSDVMHELLLHIIDSACKQKVIFEVVFPFFVCFPKLLHGMWII